MHRSTEMVCGILCITALSGCLRTAAFDMTRAWPGQLEKSHPGGALPDPERDERVSLRAILAYADRHAPAIEAATGTLARVEAERAAASLLLAEDPVLDISFGPRINTDGTAYEVEVSVQQRFEIGGQRGLRIDAANQFRKLTMAQIAEVRWRVHLEVHTAFHAALVARARMEAADRLFQFTERLLAIAQKRHRAGDISLLQVRVAEGEVARARQEKIKAGAGYRAARLTLAELAGWPTSKLPEPAGTLDKSRRAPPVADLVQRGLVRHPAVRRFAAAAELAQARKRVADREAWPDIAVAMSYIREDEATAAGTEDQHIGLVGVSIPLPLFRRNQASRARAGADVSAVNAQAAAYLRQLRARIARAADAVDAAADRLDAYGTDIIPTFAQNLRLIERAFELGEIDIVEVLAARGRFLQLERDALSAFDDYFRAVAELESQIGTEIWPDEHHVDDEEQEQ
ncbi:MAG: TolC family protein [Proteobacteria bacterium]|nr:TolC family protein [Pseudomonadota bacterium]